MDFKRLYTVVVAEGEDELREAVCAMIPWEELGFRLAGSAANGPDALRLVARQEPDLLITDVQMPQTSGLELARQVREERPDISIAFLSGGADFASVQQAVRCGAVSYLLKPLTAKELGDELRAIRQKLDARYAVPPAGGLSPNTAALMALVLDDYGSLGGGQGEEVLRRCGLLRDGGRLSFAVAVLALPAGDVRGDIPPALPRSVDRLMENYLRCASFSAPGKVVSVLSGEAEYLDSCLCVLAEELPRLAGRSLGRECRVGFSPAVQSPSDLHGAYRQAMEALLHSAQAGGGTQPSAQDSPSKGGSLLCRRALEVLNQRYMDPGLSLMSLSGMLDVSPNYLSACIKKHTGDTFISTLTRKRMEAARELLSASDLKVREIAERCGYTDQHYFSFCFKKYCGESPNSLRRRLDGKGEKTGPGKDFSHHVAQVHLGKMSK